MEIVRYLRGEWSKIVGSYALEEGIAKANWFREYYNNRNSKKMSQFFNLILKCSLSHPLTSTIIKSNLFFSIELYL